MFCRLEKCCTFAENLRVMCKQWTVRAENEKKEFALSITKYRGNDYRKWT